MKSGLLALAIAAVLTGCGGDVLDWRNASVSGGKVYAGNENTPFSGQLTNIPEHQLPFNDAFNDLLVQHNRQMERIKDRTQGFIGRHLTCDTTVEDGLVSGPTTCRNSQGVIRWKASLHGKGIDGVAEIYDVTGQKVLTSNEYTKGVANGTLKVFSPNTGKLIGEYHSKNGKADGEQTSWAENGTKTYFAEANDGKYVGIVKEWSPNGQLIGEIPYSDEGVNGQVKIWDAETGTQTASTTFVAGVKLGRATTWDTSGNVLSDGNYQADGRFVPLESAQPTATTSAANNQKSCFDQWVDAYHQELGEDAMVSHDQMTEWEEWCSEGKRPNT